MSADLAALLPDGVAVAVSRTTLDDDHGYAGERRAVARALPGRQAEFRTGRALARQALAQLGRPTVEIPVGDRREPRWPDGIVGSITHCPGLYAAAVAPLGTLSALGIDAEPTAPLPAESRDVVGDRAEWQRLCEQALPDRLLFCAKEAVFKAWFPHTRRWLDPRDVELRLDVDRAGAGTFTVIPLADSIGPDASWLADLHGTWSATNDWLLAAAFVRGSAGASAGRGSAR